YRRYFQDYFFPFETDSEDTKNFYNSIAEKYESFVPHQKEVGGVLIKLFKDLNIKKDAKILDIGAGTGIVTEELASQGFTKLTLLDISKEELNIAKSKELLKNAKFIEADLTKYKIREKYDVIFETLAFNELIEKNILIILKNIRDSLEEKGIFIMIDRHIFPELNSFFKEIKNGKFALKTPEGVFDFYFYIGKN
ncbi:MAG: methyltransferase domain-containing protein, partial [Nanoarchaeota archaeon]|nr:methyltransferase domain-containing protein [Nanoarchaeota archaeon]